MANPPRNKSTRYSTACPWVDQIPKKRPRSTLAGGLQYGLRAQKTKARGSVQHVHRSIRSDRPLVINNKDIKTCCVYCLITEPSRNRTRAICFNKQKHVIQYSMSMGRSTPKKRRRSTLAGGLQYGLRARKQKYVVQYSMSMGRSTSALLTIRILKHAVSIV